MTIDLMVGLPFASMVAFPIADHSARRKGGSESRRGRRAALGLRGCFRRMASLRVQFETMQPLKAHVRNGRIVVDEPTDRPEGELVYVALVDSSVPHEEDHLDVADRAALHSELDAALIEAETGATEDFAQAIAALRRRL